MQTYFASSSPLFSYSPCKACDPSLGFQSGESFSGVDANGTDSGMITYASSANVDIDCTGTGISFDITFAQDGIYSPQLLINGSLANTFTSANGSTSMSNTTSISNLPLGRHSYSLSLSSAPTSGLPTKDEWVRVNGAWCTLGQEQDGAQTKNVSIDDSQWREWKVVLTPGWNMLESAIGNNGSNWINTTQYDAELPTANRDFDQSISWTEQANAGNTIYFQGSAAWAYGIVGGEAGSFEVVLDNVTQGVYNASGGSRVYRSVLYHTSNLADTNHTISLRNVEQGKRLSFDRLVALSGLVTATPSIRPSSSVSIITSSTATPSPDSQPSHTSSFGTGAIVGVSVGAAAILLTLLGIALLAYRKKRKAETSEASHEKPDQTFFGWSAKPGATSSRSFIPLESPAPHEKSPSDPYLNFPSPAPSIRSKSPSPSSNKVTAKAENGKSFLKLKGKKQKNGLSISKPTLQTQGRHDETDIMPSFSENGHGQSGDNGPYQIEVDFSLPMMFAEKGNRDTFGSPPPAPTPAPPAVQPDVEVDSHRVKAIDYVNQTRTQAQAQEGRPGLERSASQLQRQRQAISISPLAAALAGKTSSPLAELVSEQQQQQSHSDEKQRGDSYFPSTLPRPSHPFARTELGGSISTLGSGLDSGLFGRRRGSLANSLDTDTRGDEASYKEKAQREPLTSGKTILSPYSTYDHSPTSQLQQQPVSAAPSSSGHLGPDPDPDPEHETDSATRDGESESERYLARVPPRESDHFTEEELPPPRPRFFGKAFAGSRPDSGASTQSANSVGSGWRYM